MEVKLNRKKLYDEIWGSSLLKVSLKYKLKEERLKIICEELQIPVPDNKYWKYYYFGEVKPQIPELPVYDGDEDYIVTSEDLIAKKKKNKVDYDDYLFYFNELEKKKIINVCESIDPNIKISNYHEVVKIIKEQHKEKDIRNKNSYFPDLLETNAEVRKRIYTILHLIFTNIEKLGYKVKYDKWIKIVILNEEVNVRIREKSSVDYIDDDSFLAVNGKRRVLVPNGMLELSIFNDYDSNDRIRVKPIKEVWVDSKKELLEDMIGSFIIELIYCATKKIVDRKDREEKIKERKKQEEILETKKRIQNEERKKLEELEKKAYDYDRAMKIRKYVELFSKNEDLSNEDREYIEWALDKADWIDPTIKKEDAILDEKLPDKVGHYVDYYW